jgi:hypothetical protein
MQTVDELYKVASISLSPNVPGQIFVSGKMHLIIYILASRLLLALPRAIDIVRLFTLQDCGKCVCKKQLFKRESLLVLLI